MELHPPLTIREKIIEFMVKNHDRIKQDVSELRRDYEVILQRENPLFYKDLKEQYEARIRQLLSFIVSDTTGIPIEPVIIEVERLDLEGYLGL